MVCPTLIRIRRKNGETDLSLYGNLHFEGQQLICGWFNRAWDLRDCTGEHCFEAFAYAWFAFNAWASCVTGDDIDRCWVETLMLSQNVCNDFAALVTDEMSPLSGYGNTFRQLWPIFSVRDLQHLIKARRQSRMRIEGNRQEVVRSYLELGAMRFAPQCWQLHKAQNEAVPLDWPHTLDALYQVRCNLFHGEKAVDSEVDQHIVSTAFRVLVHFLHSTDYLHAEPMNVYL